MKEKLAMALTETESSSVERVLREGFWHRREGSGSVARLDAIRLRRSQLPTN